MERMEITAEHRRLADSEARLADWKYWGPYLSDRAWGTVREDYSTTGKAWDYFPHDYARSRAYRWNEDGIGGFCNRFQNVCMALAFWNEADPILKERFFGLTGEQGNHGEDVKEYYYYLDGLPSHAYMKMLYRYPQAEYPYAKLVAESARRSRSQPEYELVDALRESLGERRYFDITIEYARPSQEDILCRITAVNKGPDPAPLHILPHLWFRNTWSWGYDETRPVIAAVEAGDAGYLNAHLQERHLGERFWYLKVVNAPQEEQGPSRMLFTENDTNYQRLFGSTNASPYVKDGIHAAVVNGQAQKVNPERHGTKAAGHFRCTLAPGETCTLVTRFSQEQLDDPFDGFEAIFEQRIRETDAFYAALPNDIDDPEAAAIQRQALAGMLWTKQFYHYSVELWLQGDPGQPLPPAARQSGRNREWQHVYALDVFSMPDKWEYPWFAAWDLAFHSLPLAMIEQEWAKRQLEILLREWYMHPNGQIPAYEWAFSDVNPPVHAWAAWQVYHIDARLSGKRDVEFLESMFHKLLLNFTWWVNRKDRDENNVFQGGFLGLDNVGVFDRSKPLPTGGHLDQADGTAWMGMFSLDLLRMALEIARTDPAYEDIATKFFEHFIYIANAFYEMGERGFGLWDESDGFFYDALHTPDEHYFQMKLRSYVGLIPLFAAMNLDAEMLQRLPRFKRRMEWFLRYRPQLTGRLSSLTQTGVGGDYLLAIVGEQRLRRILTRVFDPDEFLSEYGLRSLSRVYRDSPYELDVDHLRHVVRYEPAESSSGLFGGNSNWRGPIWFPINYLLINALRRFHRYYGDNFQIEMPTGSGNLVNLDQAADELATRLVRIFRADPETGARPVFGGESIFQNDPEWNDKLWFYEYFHGDNGAGLGASHQTGWTSLVARLIHDRGRID